MTDKARTRVYLVRHGETEWNQEKPGYCGWTDIPLNARGKAQAAAVGGRLQGQPLAAVLASDLTRARDTAAEIAARTGGLAVQVDARFRELNYGEWEGKSEEELGAECPEQFEAWKADPAGVTAGGGETLADVMDRAVPALQSWVERYHGESIVVVAHKTTVRLLLCWTLGIPARDYLRILQQNGAVNVIEFRGSQPYLAALNDVCHLPGDLCSPAM